MIANYHTHTHRCNHAAGADRDYVISALDAGIRILGFSDHSPMPFPAGYDFSRVRMSMDELPDYCASVLALKEEFKNEIEIHLGIELEYYPAYFGAVMKALEKDQVEYAILGQHFVGNETGEPWMGFPCGSDILRRYVDQTIEAMKTGCFLYLAHPDLPNFNGDDKDYETEMRRLCEAAEKLNIPLEINLLGLRTCRNYPDRRFWKIAGETGNKVVLGSDAHRPEDLADEDTEKSAFEMAEEFGLSLITDNILKLR